MSFIDNDQSTNTVIGFFTGIFILVIVFLTILKFIWWVILHVVPWIVGGALVIWVIRIIMNRKKPKYIRGSGWTHENQ